MDLLTKPKEAKGFVFSGNLEDVSALRNWITATGRTITALTLTYLPDNDKWEANISYSYPINGYSEYLNIKVTEGFVVATTGTSKLDYKATVEALHESYDEVSS